MTDGKHEENSTDGHFCDCASLSSAIREIVVRHVTENLVYQDSIEIGPSGDRIKVYGSADDPRGSRSSQEHARSAEVRGRSGGA
jgi:hypothetical protein